MTYIKKVSFGKVAGVSLLSFVMMFAAAAPSMTQAHAGQFSGTVDKFLTGTDPECFTGITIVKTGTTICQFMILYDGSLAIVEDTVPAEWEVTSIANIVGNCTFESAGKKAGKSATKITCDEDILVFVTVNVETRESPGTKDKPNKDPKFKPTSCGDLDLNDGAVAYASELGEKILVEVEPGIFEPIVIDVSDPITLEAVDPDDLDCDGVPNAEDLCLGDDLTGDSDGDGVCEDLDQCLDSDPINNPPIDDWGCDANQQDD